MRRSFNGHKIQFVFSFLFLLTALAPLHAQDTLPELWGVRVHDEARVLSASAIDKLEKQLRVYEDSSTNQIAILIIPTLNGKIITEYSLAVAEKWQLGTKKNDNGVLLLVAINDHAMRIEVGIGLQGVLTDVQCNRIIRNEMAPNFRKGDYQQGIQDAVDAIIKTTSGEYKTGDTPTGTVYTVTERIVTGLVIFSILALFTWMCLRSLGCLGWFLYVALIPFYVFFPWVVVGWDIGSILAGLYTLGVPIAKIFIGRSPWAKKQRAREKKLSFRGSSGSSSGSSWSSSSSSSSWSSSDSGSSFSGGGGSFDGGGSSGSW